MKKENNKGIVFKKEVFPTTTNKWIFVIMLFNFLSIPEANFVFQTSVASPNLVNLDSPKNTHREKNVSQDDIVLFSESSSSQIVPNIIVPNNPYSTVSFQLNWVDVGSQSHPAKNVSISFFLHVDSPLKNQQYNVFTNANGFYSLTYRNDAQSSITSVHLYTKSTSFEIRNPSTNSPVSYSMNYQNIYTRETCSINHNFTLNDGIFYEALYADQAAVMAEIFIKNQTGSYFPYLIISYHWGEIGSSYWSPISHDITIYRNHYCNFDVIQHEIGHQVQWWLEISDSPGGEHYGNNLADLYGKESGVLLAWGEGWATYFAFLCQERAPIFSPVVFHTGDYFYNDDWPDEITDPINVDFQYSLENHDWGAYGEASEVSVTLILVDLTDNSPNEVGDSVCYSFDDIWNLIKNHNCVSLSQLFNLLYENASLTEVKNLAALMSNEQISPENISGPEGLINYESASPIFTYQPRGGSVNYPNNDFRVVILAGWDVEDNYEDCILFASGWNVFPNNTFSFSSSVWNTIKSNYHDYPLYWTIEAEQSYPLMPTGSFFSEFVSFSID